MATFHNLKFEIVSGGKTLPMYEDPDAHENDDPLKCRKYIEAVTGATFKINVSPLPEYIRGQCDAVRVSVDLDGQNRTSKEMLKRPSLDGSNPGKTKVTFDGYSQYCQQTHQWTQGDLSFGGLEISKSLIGESATTRLANALVRGDE